MQRNLTHLWDLLEPVVTGLGYELVEIEYNPSARHGLLRLYIDHEDGIQLDDCTDVSNQVSALLDVEDPIPGQYNLEVSSPGLDRPLRGIEDYERFNGEIVKIRTGMAIDGRRNFKGRLLGIEGDAINIECDGQQFLLPLASIEKARLVPEFGTQLQTR
ncbi:MAG: ribosome maturation factor RimP [Gammaproteobacteria bacterium]|nr:ribosome maturation factor RimP [Gammaproteobacteria bacterium]NNL06083.1 ribosome maturation factor RimP [Gammaproteobacteria bacterium]